MTRAPRMLLACVLLGVAFLPGRAGAEDLVVESRPVRWRLGLENVRLPGGEDMGLASVHYDVFGLVKAAPGLYAGIGAFGAVSGNRGGFFVGGAGAGYRQGLAEGLGLDVGVFAGGGGGGSGPQGGGLMVRPAIAVEKSLGEIVLRAEVARVLFPNGEIRSTDLLLGIGIPSDRTAARLMTPGDEASPTNWERGPERVQAGWMRYAPDDASRRRSAGRLSAGIDLVGAEFDIFLDRGFFLPLAAYGAFGGEAAGYMTILGGVGARRYLGGAWWWDLRILAGAGGGGDVDTGGGILLQPMAGIGRRFGAGWILSLDGGYTWAPDGQFRAPTFRAMAGREAEAFRPIFLDGGRGPVSVPGDAASLDAWSFSVGNKTYRPRDGVKNTAGRPSEGTVQLVCGGAEKPLLSWLFLAGEGCSAWEGGAGGYSEGILDVRVRTVPFRAFPGHALGARFGAGAGGGGGMDAGSGLLGTAAAGWRYEILPDLFLFVDAGRTDARRGTFSADYVQFGLSGTVHRAVARERSGHP